ncbi:TlpA family protein disulfide reductase [Thermoactinospora rubra]|uniref:TlpA family protein disulfide reductase n=1 Tax=Thermoactinospora rubra TaxID=1088767 RepID=UPI0011811132|nr:TlpA disulfide reductase family protein [Thermoactinospora rubra]
MAYLVAAVALIGLLAALNLLFTVGVIRRLREHTAELAALRGRGAAQGGPAPLPEEVALPAGSPIGGFTAVTVDGAPVALEVFGERPLVAFLSPHCLPCKEQLPAFIEYAAARPGGPDAVLAVVVGTQEEAAQTVARLRPVAAVVVEPDGGPLQQAFAVTGFPAFVLVQQGRVAASDYELRSVAERDAAALPSAG